MRFTQCFTAALCGPSRALIMTGRYAFRNGATNQDACMRLPKGDCGGRDLQAAGYATSCIGKWGQLPGEPDASMDSTTTCASTAAAYTGTRRPAKPERYASTARSEARPKEYMPDLMHDAGHELSSAHRTKPFFLYYCLSHVHGDILPTPDSAAGQQGLYRRQHRLHGQARRQTRRRTRSAEAAREHAHHVHGRQRHRQRPDPNAPPSAAAPSPA